MWLKHCLHCVKVKTGNLIAVCSRSLKANKMYKLLEKWLFYFFQSRGLFFFKKNRHGLMFGASMS